MDGPIHSGSAADVHFHEKCLFFTYMINIICQMANRTTRPAIHRILHM